MCGTIGKSKAGAGEELSGSGELYGFSTPLSDLRSTDADERRRIVVGVVGMVWGLWYVVHGDQLTRFLGGPEADSVEDDGGVISREDATEPSSARWAATLDLDLGDSLGGVGGRGGICSNGRCWCFVGLTW